MTMQGTTTPESFQPLYQQVVFKWLPPYIFHAHLS